MKVVFATGNPSKSKRFNKYLINTGIELITLKDLDIKLDVVESGNNAIENALIKARRSYEITKMPSMGMDDNLFLEGVPESFQPGVFVRRVNGKELNDEEMIEHYTSLVKKYGNNGVLKAKWVYGLAIVVDGKEYTYTWEKDDFYFTDTKSNIINPGYPLNSISKYKVLDKYFSEITEEDKEKISFDESDVGKFIIKTIKK